MGLRLAFISLWGCSLLLAVNTASADASRQVPPELQKSALYSMEDSVHGIRIRSMPGVSAEAIEIAKARLAMLLEHLPQVAANLADAGAELRIMTGYPNTDVTGGLVSYATEENILKNERDRFTDHRDICVHECAHMLHTAFGPEQCAAITQRFAEAQAAGLWPGCYAMTNESEFFAELTMWYFGTRGDYGRLPEPQEGPAWLKQYDPQSYELLDSIYSGRLLSRRIEWKRLADRGAAAEGSLKSLDSGQPSQIQYVNNTGGTVSYYWLDFEGKRVPYGTVEAGERGSMSTFISHPWLLTDSAGTVLGIWVPETTHDRIVVE
ncbi:hypothetical protein IT575_15685 [bacterium]|nr:hypothetical protein [bacterium]